MADGWEVKDDQSATSGADFRASDLQIAEVTLTSTEGVTSGSASMKHKMGLVGLTLNDHDVYDILYYDGNTYNASNTPKWTVNTTKSSTTKSTWTGSTNFSGTYVPFVKEAVCYQVVKPTVTVPSYSASIDNTNKKYPWSQACMVIASANSFKNYDIDYDVDFITACWEFSYSGTGQQWVAPQTGTYKLEVWGASGSNPETLGGMGGYSYYNVTLKKEDNLHVYMGECYTDGVTNGSYYWPFNGGGRCSYGGQAGGGASHIAIGETDRGELKNYNSYRSEVLVVAGGGGGQDGSGGGYAGGTVGQDAPGVWGGYSGGKGGNNSTGVGVSQANYSKTVTNGTFGLGGYQNDISVDAGGSGGGGWVGGGGASHCAGGGGGTGYVNTSATGFISGETKAGNTSFPIPTGTTNETGHSGSGAARITFTP